MTIDQWNDVEWGALFSDTPIPWHQRFRPTSRDRPMPRVDCVFLLNPLHLNQFVTEYYQFLMFIFAETLFPEFWHSSWPGVGEHRDVSCRLSLTNPWKTMDHGALFLARNWQFRSARTMTWWAIWCRSLLRTSTEVVPIIYITGRWETTNFQESSSTNQDQSILIGLMTMSLRRLGPFRCQCIERVPASSDSSGSVGKSQQFGC